MRERITPHCVEQSINLKLIDLALHNLDYNHALMVLLQISIKLRLNLRPIIKRRFERKELKIEDKEESERKRGGRKGMRRDEDKKTHH